MGQGSISVDQGAAPVRHVSDDADLSRLLVTYSRLLRSGGVEKVLLEVQPPASKWIDEEEEDGGGGGGKLAELKRQQREQAAKKYTNHLLELENDVKWLIVTPQVRHRGAEAVVHVVEDQNVELLGFDEAEALELPTMLMENGRNGELANALGERGGLLAAGEGEMRDEHDYDDGAEHDHDGDEDGGSGDGSHSSATRTQKGRRKPKQVLSFRVKNLVEGANNIKIQVSAENGATTKVYSIEVRRKEWQLDAWKPGNLRAKYRWYLQGAEDGNVEAQFRLALMYAGEDGQVLVPPTHSEELSSSEPETVSEDKLVPIDEGIAQLRHYKWLVFSAENGHIPAQQRLAMMWLRKEVPEDAEEYLDAERLRMIAVADQTGQALKAFVRSRFESRVHSDAGLAPGSSQGLHSSLKLQREFSRDSLGAGDSEHGNALSAHIVENELMAFQWFYRAARQGDSASAERVGLMYCDGQGTSLDFKKAIVWLHKSGLTKEESIKAVHKRLSAAAEDGSERAAYALAMIYIEGVGVPMDYRIALDWLNRTGREAAEVEEELAGLFTAAAKAGNRDSCYQTALLYMDGVGVERDYKHALHWLHMSGMEKAEAYEFVIKSFKDAAEGGVAAAAYQLALLYIDGVGVHMDYKEALVWLTKAGERADEAQQFVAKRLRAAAEKGNPRSAYQFSLMHVHGVGVSMDYVAALEWLGKAGQPVTTAHKQAASWFQQAAEAGDKRAAYQLALMFVDGVGVQMSFVTALEWLVEAGQSEKFAQRLVHDRLKARAEDRDVPSCYQLAQMLMDYENSLQYLVDEGHEEEWFHTRAAEYFITAAEEGDSVCALTVANMYVNGIGLPIDFKRAIFWYEQGGRDKRYAMKQIEKKLQSLKPKYKSLFKSYASRNGGVIDLVQFAGFYRDCLMAKGIPKAKADSETRSVYQGKQKYEILFRSYDKNHDKSIDFEEVWGHAHTHTTLFPKTGKHVMAANEFFADFKPLAHEESLADLRKPLVGSPRSSGSGSMSARFHRTASKRGHGGKRSKTPRLRSSGSSKSIPEEEDLDE